MPIFEYRCSQCKTEFEQLVFATDETEIKCPECKSCEVYKKMSATGLTGSFKCSSGGSGVQRPFS